MRKITLEEARKLKFKERGGQISLLSEQIISLKEEEILFIDRKEWKKKTAPTQLIRNATRHPRSKLHNAKIWTRQAEEGWIIGKGDKPKEL